MKNAIFPLFACPIMVCGTEYEFSDAEREYFDGLETVNNSGNLMSSNDRVLDSEELADLRKFVEAQVFNYKKNLLRIRDDNEIYITQSWINRSCTGEFHPRHKHPNSIISGVMFLGEDDGTLPPLRIHRSFEIFPLGFAFDELNEFNASSREFEPRQGILMLFPSQVEHDVDRNASDLERVTLSFNTWVRGRVGAKDLLTEVEVS